MNAFDANPEPGLSSGDRLEPEFALPAQVHHVWHHTVSVRPERRLLIAVLEQAMADVARGDPDRPVDEIHRDAVEWVRSGDRRHAFAFASICDVLDLPEETVRGIVLRRGASLRGLPRMRRAGGDPAEGAAGGARRSGLANAA